MRDRLPLTMFDVRVVGPMRDFANEMRASRGDDLGPMFFRDVARLCDAYERLDRVLYAPYLPPRDEANAGSDDDQPAEEVREMSDKATLYLIVRASDQAYDSLDDDPQSEDNLLIARAWEAAEEAAKRVLAGSRFDLIADYEGSWVAL